MDHDEGPEVCSETRPKARKEHRCCECRRIIKKGEQYNNTSGLWDGGWDTYKTCTDCESIRDALFCSFIYETLWGQLSETFSDSPEVPSAECMMKLTKPARDKVCDLIEKYWEEE